MKNHKELFEALLAGETLEGGHNGYLIKLSDKGELMATVNGSNNFVYFHNTKALIDRHEDYSIRPKTININGFDIPEPLKYTEGLYPSFYYMPNLYGDQLFVEMNYTGCGYDKETIRRGLAHQTKEAAILHAKALLSLTRKDND